MQRQQYRNMDNIMTEKTWKQFQRWRTERKVRLQHKDYSYAVPHVQPDMQRLITNRTDTTATWIGHSTFLLQMGSLNMVTDPIWASSMAMQKRLTEPGIPIEQMPSIDVILISHSHYDHLHLKSLRQLATDNTLVIVPSGLCSKMKRKGFSNTIQLKWWESATVGDVRITFVPAQHWTRRTLTDTNRSHWGGFVLEHVDALCSEVKETIYFAGDSGYFRGFREIGERFAIDIAMLPIGAYEPEWFMGAQHVTPEEALQAFIDVQAKLMLPMHYGAFKLADDTPKEAIDRLLAERERLGIDEERVRLMALGETCDLSQVENRQCVYETKQKVAQQGAVDKSLLRKR